MAQKQSKYKNFEKSLKDFIKDEDGFVSKKSILRVGLGTIAAMGVLGSMNPAFGDHFSHNVHVNDDGFIGVEDVPGTQCRRVTMTGHVNHDLDHMSHDSY